MFGFHQFLELGKLCKEYVRLFRINQLIGIKKQQIISLLIADVAVLLTAKHLRQLMSYWERQKKGSARKSYRPDFR